MAKNLGEYLKEQRRSAQLTLRQLAEEAEVSNPYLSQIERGLRRPSADVLQRLAGALEISSEALYVRAGLLEEDQRPGGRVLDALQADEAITSRQRRILMDIYSTFLRDNARSEDVRGGDVSDGSTTKHHTNQEKE